jgi:hypothetical protein
MDGLILLVLHNVYWPLLQPRGLCVYSVGFFLPNTILKPIFNICIRHESHDKVIINIFSEDAKSQ